MQTPQTQQLSDGERYYVIQNGVRLTGMPAWGSAGDGDGNRDSWKLVLLIRHLPRMTTQEAEQMQELNPRTIQEFEEEKNGTGVSKRIGSDADLIFRDKLL